MVRRDAQPEPRRPSVGTQRGEVAGIDFGQASRGQLVDAGRLVLAGVADTPARQPGDGLVTTLAAEDEPDGRKQSSGLQLGQQVRPPRRTPRQGLRVDPAPAPAAAADHRDVEAPALGVGRASGEDRHRANRAAAVPAHGVEVGQGDGPARLDHDPGRAVDAIEPPAELVMVRDRGRQAHEPDPLGEVENDLLPDGSSVGILEVVHLVEHDHRQPVVHGSGVEHVAKHLGGHDHRASVSGNGVVAGQQAHVPGSEPSAHIPVLLVGQGLDRSGVEGAATRRQGGVDRMVRHQGLARTGGGAHEHRAAGVEMPDGVYLELVENEASRRRRGHDPAASRLRCRRRAMIPHRIASS